MAARVDSSSQEWIKAIIRNYESKHYTVEDAEPEKPGQAPKYKLEESNIYFTKTPGPLPPDYKWATKGGSYSNPVPSRAQDYNMLANKMLMNFLADEAVLALYPGTSTFYEAEIREANVKVSSSSFHLNIIFNF